MNLSEIVIISELILTFITLIAVSNKIIKQVKDFIELSKIQKQKLKKIKTILKSGYINGFDDNKIKNTELWSQLKEKFHNKILINKESVT